MKREIKAPKQTTVNYPKPSKAYERKFEQATAAMIRLMSRLYRSQALESLTAETVGKFADAQTGNFANVFLGMAEATRRKLTERFDDKRIEALAREILTSTDDTTRKRFYAEVGSKIGIDPVRLMAEEGLKSTTNALMQETAQWLKKLRDDTLQEYTANSLRSMTLGKPITEIMAEYDGMVGKRVDHAKFTARNQINNYTSIVGKIRAENLGVAEAVWVTVGDGDRVRASHRDRNGKTYKLSEGLYSSVDGKTLFPGIDFACRCSARYIIPEGA